VEQAMNSMNTLEAAPGLIGVLGGMGPLATVDFMQKLIAATALANGAHRDQDHVPVVVSSIPQIPDRVAAFRGEGISPLAAMVSSGQRLINAGAGLIVVPCNTAHLWFAELEAALQAPMLHLVDAALEDAASGMQAGANLGLLCTDATLASGLYQTRAAQSEKYAAVHWTLPTASEMLTLVVPGIQAVKLGQLDQARDLLSEAAKALVRRGAGSLVLGCTEIPLVLNSASNQFQVPVVDATASLARRAVTWSLAQRQLVLA
jgi:aspartate racemase